MIRRFLIFTVCILSGYISANAQDTIFYKLPYRVEAELAERILHFRSGRYGHLPLSIYLGRRIHKDGEISFETDRHPYDCKEGKRLTTQVSASTHRYARIGDEVFPLYLLYDERLGSPTPKADRGAIFDRDCKIRKQVTILEILFYFNLNEGGSIRTQRIGAPTQGESSFNTPDSIFYTISDLTERNIYNYIRKNYPDRKEDICIFYGVWSKGKTDTPYVVLPIPKTPGDYASKLKESSNRYIMINNDVYPVIFDLDFVFADSDITSQYVKYRLLDDGKSYEFSFPGEHEPFEHISMWGVDVTGYTLEED